VGIMSIESMEIETFDRSIKEMYEILRLIKTYVYQMEHILEKIYRPRKGDK
jgi:hypothetical protein